MSGFSIRVCGVLGSKTPLVGKRRWYISNPKTTGRQPMRDHPAIFVTFEPPSAATVALLVTRIVQSKTAWLAFPTVCISTKPVNLLASAQGILRGVVYHFEVARKSVYKLHLFLNE